MRSASSFPETLKASHTKWEIGPYSALFPVPLRLKLDLDGEIISYAEVETGFAHRGLEAALTRETWQKSLVYAGHLDPESSVFGELSLCLAVEELLRISVSPRAQMIRIILSELTRISAHLTFIVRVAQAVGAETIAQYVLRDREKDFRSFELLTGARYSVGFLRFGGVKMDITDGFVERVIETSEIARIRIKEYNDLFTFNHVFLKRTEGVGAISSDLIKKMGVTGPNARAAGVAFDVRREHPYSSFQLFDFEVSGSISGDCHDRFLVRLREISQSVEILKHACEIIPSGSFCEFKTGKSTAIPAGEAFSRIESSRGLLGCHIISNGSLKPASVHFRTPSTESLSVLPLLLRGLRVEDMPVVLASLDLSISEVDR